MWTVVLKKSLVSNNHFAEIMVKTGMIQVLSSADNRYEEAMIYVPVSRFFHI